MDNEFTEERFNQLNGQVTVKGEVTVRLVAEGTLLSHMRRPTDGREQDTKGLNRLVGNIKLKLMRRAQPSGLSPDFFNDFSDRLLGLLPLKHRERAYEPSKYDAEANRLERLEKDGNEEAANREYRREIRQLVLSTFLALPRFYVGEILDQIRRMVAR
jgi:hypothetical protein